MCGDIDNSVVLSYEGPIHQSNRHDCITDLQQCGNDQKANAVSNSPCRSRDLVTNGVKGRVATRASAFRIAGTWEGSAGTCFKKGACRGFPSLSPVQVGSGRFTKCDPKSSSRLGPS